MEEHVKSDENKSPMNELITLDDEKGNVKSNENESPEKKNKLDEKDEDDDPEKESPVRKIMKLDEKNNSESNVSPVRKLSKAERAAEKEKREAERIEKLKQKEAERLKREEEKRKRDEEKEQERLKREEEKRKKDEEKEQERLKREEEKRKKDEEKEQERLKREEEKRKKDEEKEQERLKREEEKRKKDDEKEQQRLKREEERLKKELEKKQKIDEKEKEKLKEEEVKSKQAEFLTRFLQKTPGGSRKSVSGEERDRSLKSHNSDPAVDTSITSGVGSEMDVSVNCEPEISIVETSDDVTLNGFFKSMPFQVKTGMALAPRLRRKPLTLDEKLVVDIVMNPIVKETPADEPLDMEVQNCEGVVEKDPEGINQGLYLSALKKGFGRKGGRTEVRREIFDEDNEIQVLDQKEEDEFDEEIGNPYSDAAADGLVRFRWKLIQFHDNTRPAYWGTWKRRPLKVKGKCPFKQEEELDYEFDSDDEWEEEPADGEDLNSEKDEEEEEPEAPNPDDDDDEEGSGWMVPHGYLSDDEGASEEKRDIDTLKKQEEEFYKNIGRENTLGLPIIETENLSQYRMIFPPKRRVRRGAQRKSTCPFNQVCDALKTGTYGGELLESDEDDGDWEESSSSSCDSESDDESADSVASADLDNDHKDEKIDDEEDEEIEEDEDEEIEEDGDEEAEEDGDEEVEEDGDEHMEMEIMKLDSPPRKINTNDGDEVLDLVEPPIAVNITPPHVNGICEISSVPNL